MTDPNTSPREFSIRGRTYAWPEPGTITLDEAIIIHRYSGLTIDQIDEVEGFHPGLTKGMLHIGVRRTFPDSKYSEVEKMLGQLTVNEVLEIFEQFAVDEEEDEGGDLPNPPSGDEPPSSETGDVRSSGPSGESGTETSSPDRETDGGFGSLPSPTGSASAPVTSEA